MIPSVPNSPDQILCPKNIEIFIILNIIALIIIFLYKHDSDFLQFPTLQTRFSTQERFQVMTSWLVRHQLETTEENILFKDLKNVLPREWDYEKFYKI